MQTYYRLSMILDYVFLPSPPASPFTPKLYHTPLKFTGGGPPPRWKVRMEDRLKRKIEDKKGGSTIPSIFKGNKKKKEMHLRKEMKKIVFLDYDRYLHKEYPRLFSEIHAFLEEEVPK